MGIRRSNLLVLSPTFPYPPVSGGDIRLFQLLRGLSAQFEVHLLPFAGGAAERLIAETGISAVHVYDSANGPAPSWLKKQRIKFWRGAPHGISLEVDPAYAQALRRVVAAHRFQGVLIDHLYMMQYARFVSPVAVFYSATDVETMKFARWHDGETLTPKRRLLHWAQRRVIQWYESRTGRVARVTFATSEVDRALLAQMNRMGRVVVAPNGVDLSYFRPRSRDSFAGPPAVCFVGTMYYRPNYHAARVLAQEVFPLVREQIPEAVCHLAGKTDRQEFAELNQPERGVFMHGFVEDIRSYFEHAHVLVVPLVVGSGTRIKILEAMASGTPVVSTSIGAEGLECADGENIMITDSVAGLAAAVVRLLRNREECFRIGAAGRRLVEGKYSWDASAEVVRTEISRVLNGPLEA